MTTRDLVPHRQPGRCTATRPLDQVAAQSQADRRAAGRRRRHPRASGVEAGAHRRRRDPARLPRRQRRRRGASGVIAWMHTFSPAKMWIAGLDALRKPLLHLHTQANVALPWAEHRHGLHEPQPGRARRPRVRLHPDPARRRPQDRRRPRQRPAGDGPDRRLGPGGRGGAPRCARCGWPASATTCATSPSPRATRSRPQLRFGVSVNTYGVNDLVAAVDAARDADVDSAGRRVRRTATRSSPELRPRRRPARVAALRAPGSSSACGTSSTPAASARSPPTSRTSAGCASCPAWPCSG